MWWWTAGWSWPGFALMAVFMVICLAMMARMMGLTGGMGMCGFWRWREPRPVVDKRTAGDRTHADTGIPD